MKEMTFFRIALILFCTLDFVEGTYDEFITLKEKIIRFQYEQQGKFNTFKQQFEALEQSLWNEIENEKLKNEELEGTVKALKQKNSELKEKVKETELKLEEMYNFNKVKTEQVQSKELTDSDTDKHCGSWRNDVYKKDKTDQSKNPKTMASGGPDVAFFSNTLNEYTDALDAVVHFPSTMFNYGNCYDASNGIFSCETSGTYVFSFDLICAPGNFIKTALVKDDKVLTFCTCDTKDGNFDTCGTTTVTHCKSGESIWIEVLETDQDVGAFYGQNTFSGYLLHQD